MTNIFKKINFRQPKYIIPAIAYIPLLVTIYLFIDAFSTAPVEVTTMEKTDYYNDKLPPAVLAGDGIGDKHANMLEIFGDISDLTALDNLADEDPDDSKEKYETVLSDSERLAILDAAKEREAALALEKKIRAQADGELKDIPSEEERMEALASMEQQRQKELDDVLEQIRQQREDMSVSSDMTISDAMPDVTGAEEDIHTVKKQEKVMSEYFNTVAASKASSSLIQAIIDENLKAKNDSRIRLRLLDDIDIDGRQLPKGSYIFANIRGLGGQRVQATISSVLVGDEILQVNLEVYDTDGLSGLYVPKSDFRETGKDVLSSALNGSMNISSGATGNDLAQFAMQGLQNMYQQTTNAISKAIRKNTVNLKYGSIVYLVNGNNQR